MPDAKFTYNELMAIYAITKETRDSFNDMLDRIDANDPERAAIIENNKVFNSILRKLNAILDENGWSFKDL